MMQYLLYALVFAAVSAAGYTVVRSYNNAITEREQFAAALETARVVNLELEREAIRKEFEAEANRKEREELEAEFSRAREEQQELQQLFQRHELDVIYEKKPGLILARINRASGVLFSDIAATINRTDPPENPVRQPAGN